MAERERVDVVNEQNEVMYDVFKDEAHQQGLLHRTVISEVVNSRGEWLLVRQSSDRQDAGQYVSPVGGHVRAGESEDEALKREAMEELHFKDFEYSFIGRVIHNRFVVGRQENHFFILYSIKSDSEPVLNEESESHRYFSVDELRKEIVDNPQNFGDAFHFLVNTLLSDSLKS